jgi:hypothetical protein
MKSMTICTSHRLQSKPHDEKLGIYSIVTNSVQSFARLDFQSPPDMKHAYYCNGTKRAWVEVQAERMDEIAEKGYAAH